MSRYDLKIEQRNTRAKQGVFLLLLVLAVFFIAYNYEVGKERTSQTVVSKDYEACLQSICINRGGNEYSECLYLDTPTICNIKVVTMSPTASRQVKRLEIDPLSAKCEGY